MYAIMRTKKIKSFAGISSLEGHNTRKYETPNADTSKTKNNIVLFDSNDFVLDTRSRIGNRTIRKNAVYGIELLLTASPEFFRKNADDHGMYEKNKVLEFNNAVSKFLKNEFGEKNIISAICHLDEATPHVQTLIVPINPNTDRLDAQHWLDGRKKMQGLQDRFWESVGHLGLDRGVRGSKADHIPIKQWYGAMKSETVPIIDVSVSNPPTICPKPTLWAAMESKKLTESTKKVVSDITNKAGHALFAHKKMVGTNRTNKFLSSKIQELEDEKMQIQTELDKKNLELKRIRDDARNIDISGLIEKYGAKKTGANTYELNGESISIKGQKFHNHYSDKGGGGAIDLVMHIENIDFKSAFARLSYDFGSQVAKNETVLKAKLQADNLISSEKNTPISAVPSSENWPHVRNYLINKRKLDPSVIDSLHDKGIVFADSMKNACFKYENGVELRGTGTEKWRGFRGKKDGGIKFGNGSRSVILVESAIEAISIMQLHDLKGFDVVGIGGTSVEVAHKICNGYETVIFALNNDAPGNKAKDEISKLLKCEIDELSPEFGGDWNEVLQMKIEKSLKNKNNELINESINEICP
jgi:hypothetical protein